MKYIKILVIGFLCTMLIVGNTSCSKAFLEENPTTAVGTDEAFSTVRNCVSGSVGIHAALASQSLFGRNLILIGDLATDNVTSLNANSGHMYDIEIWNVLPSTSEIAAMWFNSYSVIAAASKLNNGCDALIANMDPTKRDGDIKTLQFVKAQTYAVKALMESVLLDYFTLPYKKGNNGIILIGNSVPTPTTTVNSSDLESSYQHLLANIEEAKKLFKLSGYDAKKAIGASQNEWFISQAFVYGLEARVRLNMARNTSDYAAVISAADSALLLRAGTGLVYDEAKFIEQFKSTTPSSEDLFVITMTSADNLGANGLANYFSNYGGRASGAAINDIPANDIRSKLYRASVPSNKEVAKIYTTVSKYPNENDVNNSPVMRLGEMYLILAEAYYRSGNEQKAKENLLVVAKRSPNITDMASMETAIGGNFLSYMKKQRRAELLCEGLRWMDLRRYGVLDNEELVRKGKSGSDSQSDFRTVFADFSLSEFAYPIPENELNAPQSEVKQNEVWLGDIPNPTPPTDAGEVK